MYRFVVITDSLTAPGFRLGGVEVISIGGGDDVNRILAECLDNPSIGLVAINDGFLEKLQQQILRKVERSSAPVVVPFPDPLRRDTKIGKDFISSLISKAIGYRIRLRN